MKQPGRTKRGRPQLRWEDYVKRAVRKAEDDDKSRENVANREKWKEIIAGTVQQYMN